jgi:hypothetical protein
MTKTESDQDLKILNPSLRGRFQLAKKIGTRREANWR